MVPVVSYTKPTDNIRAALGDCHRLQLELQVFFQFICLQGRDRRLVFVLGKLAVAELVSSPGFFLRRFDHDLAFLVHNYIFALNGKFDAFLFGHLVEESL